MQRGRHAAPGLAERRRDDAKRALDQRVDADEDRAEDCEDPREGRLDRPDDLADRAAGARQRGTGTGPPAAPWLLAVGLAARSPPLLPPLLRGRVRRVIRLLVALTVALIRGGVQVRLGLRLGLRRLGFGGLGLPLGALAGLALASPRRLALTLGRLLAPTPRPAPWRLGLGFLAALLVGLVAALRGPLWRHLLVCGRQGPPWSQRPLSPRPYFTPSGTRSRRSPPRVGCPRPAPRRPRSAPPEAPRRTVGIDHEHRQRSANMPLRSRLPVTAARALSFTHGEQQNIGNFRVARGARCAEARKGLFSARDPDGLRGR